MFKEYYQKKLIAEINKAAGKEELKAGANVMDIMEKLSYLSASEATPDGEKRYWIILLQREPQREVRHLQRRRRVRLCGCYARQLPTCIGTFKDWLQCLCPDLPSRRTDRL